MNDRQFTAGACRYAALAFAGSESAAQRAFAPTLAMWTDRFVARAAAKPEQMDLFGTTVSDASPCEAS